MNFGKTILDLRKAKKVTQEDMAAELGVTAAAVSKWENNYTLPDIPMLCAIADYFHITTDALLGRANDGKDNGNTVQNKMYHAQLLDFVKQHGIPMEILNNIQRKLQE